MKAKKTANRRFVAALVAVFVLLFAQAATAGHLVEHAGEAGCDDLCVVCVVGGNLDIGTAPAGVQLVGSEVPLSGPPKLASCDSSPSSGSPPPARGPPAIA